MPALNLGSTLPSVARDRTDPALPSTAPAQPSRNLRAALPPPVNISATTTRNPLTSAIPTVRSARGNRHDHRRSVRGVARTKCGCTPGVRHPVTPGTTVNPRTGHTHRVRPVRPVARRLQPLDGGRERQPPATADDHAELHAELAGRGRVAFDFPDDTGEHIATIRSDGTGQRQLTSRHPGGR